MTIPKYNIQKKLEPGDNIIEFTPDEDGNISYTCWMGMIRSNIKDVSEITNVSNSEIEQSNDSSSSESVGGSCCGH